MNSIVLDTELLWKSIYSARDAEKYWRTRRRMGLQMGGGDDIYTQEELEVKYQEARKVTRSLERLAPSDTW